MPTRNEKESLICNVFAEILKLDRFGINQDFFELGGNSMHVIKALPTLRSTIDVNAADIFNLKTPEKIAEVALINKNLPQQQLDRVKELYELFY